MEFLTGFAVWLALGLAGGFLARAVYRADGTALAYAIVFGLFGAFIGGMLGTSPYIHHDPVPLRLGGLIGAATGGFGFPFLYQFIARNAT
jgi:uncharacterized membrane protein YeaQ/YmgE (transglycosylase-associated protein family)